MEVGPWFLVLTMSEQDSPASKCGKFSQQIEFSVDAIPQQMLFHTLGLENVDI